ncbi:hypothetical protein MRX96_019461 [Rhipicephalus microplus]
MSVKKGQKTRGRAIPTGSCNTPRGTSPYSGQRQQRPETRPEGPLAEAGRTLCISELFRRLPGQIASQSGVTTRFDRRVRQPGVPATSLKYGLRQRRPASWGAAVLLLRQ